MTRPNILDDPGVVLKMPLHAVAAVDELTDCIMPYELISHRRAVRCFTAAMFFCKQRPR